MKYLLKYIYIFQIKSCVFSWSSSPFEIGRKMIENQQNIYNFVKLKTEIGVRVSFWERFTFEFPFPRLQAEADCTVQVSAYYDFHHHSSGRQ